jgi:hypothetical protein
MGVAVGLTGFVLIEGLVFHTGFYVSMLTPDSSTGMFELVISMEKEREKSGKPQVVAVGDSRQALRPAVANALGTGYEFANAGVGGTTPRCWYYELRELDPQRDRYAAILLPVEGYDDEDTGDNLADRLTDLRYLVSRIYLGDAWEYAFSYLTFDSGWRALAGVLLKGPVYKQDLREFLANPRKRLNDVDARRAYWRETIRTYPGEYKDLAGLSIDWKEWKADYPARLTPGERQTIDDILLRRPVPQEGFSAAYNRKWFGKIIDRYRGTRTKLAFYRLPRGPIARPEGLVKRETSSVREFGARPGVILLDEHAFEELERPEYFIDPLHLNAEGCKRYSAILARHVGTALGGANAF